MPDASCSRKALKEACLALLDQVALEHPSGHQGKLAARYVFKSAGGEHIELMFDKGPASPANLWVCQRYVGCLDLEKLTHRLSPAHVLFKTKGKDERPRYGRHSGLRSMRQLSNADLICFNLQSVAQLQDVLDGLVA